MVFDLMLLLRRYTPRNDNYNWMLDVGLCAEALAEV